VIVAEHNNNHNLQLPLNYNFCSKTVNNLDYTASSVFIKFVTDAVQTLDKKVTNESGTELFFSNVMCKIKK
jgi:ribosomal protein S18